MLLRPNGPASPLANPLANEINNNSQTAQHTTNDSKNIHSTIITQRRNGRHSSITQSERDETSTSTNNKKQRPRLVGVTVHDERDSNQVGTQESEEAKMIAGHDGNPVVVVGVGSCTAVEDGGDHGCSSRDDEREESVLRLNNISIRSRYTIRETHLKDTLVATTHKLANHIRPNSKDRHSNKTIHNLHQLNPTQELRTEAI